MITEQEFRAIRERVLKASQADETELCLGGGREELTRFGENRITQNVSEERYELRVRTRFGRRQGLATTNDFSPAGLERCVENAAALARIQPESERVIEFQAGGERSEATAWAADTAAVDAAARARWVETAVKVAAGHGIELGGIALSSEGSIGDYGEIEPFAVANSTGLLRFGRKTRAVFEVSAAKGDGAGRSRVLAKSAAAVDPVRVAEDACRRCLESRAPAALAPGDYTVVFEAEAAQDLLFFLAYLGFNGLAVAEKRSPLGERLGERVFGENITLREVPGDPRLFGLGFDAEGVDTQAVTLIDKGVLTSFLHDRTSARLDGADGNRARPAPAQQCRRLPALSRARRRQGQPGRAHRRRRARRARHAAVVHERRRPDADDHHRHDPRRDLPDREGGAGRAGEELPFQPELGGALQSRGAARRGADPGRHGAAPPARAGFPLQQRHGFLDSIGSSKASRGRLSRRRPLQLFLTICKTKDCRD